MTQFRHEKVFKREGGVRVKIVAVFSDQYLRQSHYQIAVSTCEPRKRTFVPVVDTHKYSFRSMNRQEKSEFTQVEILKVVTEDEIKLALSELHDKMKPESWDIY